MSDVRRVVNDIVQEAGGSAGLAAEISAWEDPPHAAPPHAAPVLAVDGLEIAEAVVSGRKTAAQMARIFGVSPPTVSRVVAAHIAGQG